MAALGGNRSVERAGSRRLGFIPLPYEAIAPTASGSYRKGDSEQAIRIPRRRCRSRCLSVRGKKCSGGDQQLPVDFSEMIYHVLVAGVYSFDKRFQHRYFFASGHQYRLTVNDVQLAQDTVQVIGQAACI